MAARAYRVASPFEPRRAALVNINRWGGAHPGDSGW